MQGNLTKARKKVGSGNAVEVGILSPEGPQPIKGFKVDSSTDVSEKIDSPTDKGFVNFPQIIEEESPEKESEEIINPTNLNSTEELIPLQNMPSSYKDNPNFHQFPVVIPKTSTTITNTISPPFKRTGTMIIFIKILFRKCWKYEKPNKYF